MSYPVKSLIIYVVRKSPQGSIAYLLLSIEIALIEPSYHCIISAVLSSKLALFTDKSRSPEAMMVEERTLEELGHNGGSVEEPTYLTLYYDYIVEFTDCAILMCDHYF